MEKPHLSDKPFRLFFWPVILLGAGVIWLLSNLNIIPTENLWILFHLWPVLIIVAGLDVLFSRWFPLLGALLALLVMGGVIYILLHGESVILAAKLEPQTESIVVEVEDATTARLNLKLSSQTVFIKALETSDNLIEATIGHYNDLEFMISGTEEKNLSLQRTGMIPWFNVLLPEVEGLVMDWHIGLNPEIPFILDIDASTGQSELDLAGIQLAELGFEGGTGASKIILPALPDGYETRIDAGSGILTIILPEESNLTLRLVGSTGKIIMKMPEGAAVRMEVIRGGSGDVFVPDWINKISGDDGRDEGVYQSAGYEVSLAQMLILIEDINAGNIILE